MATEICRRATQDALRVGRALLKFISANDAGATGAHQRGFYLPLDAWQLLTPQPPEQGVNHDHLVPIVWQDGLETASCVKWYGRGTRFEYRLTRFGRHFPFLTTDSVGNLFVLIPESRDRFLAYVLEDDDDIEEIQANLGARVTATWVLYERDSSPQDDEPSCVQGLLSEFAASADAFPPGAEFSRAAWEALEQCSAGFSAESPDQQLVAALDTEYTLFRLVEQRLCLEDARGPFSSIEQFLKVALAITQRRKSRAGRSLENHVERLLSEAEIPYASRQIADGTRPDLVIPGIAEYDDPDYPIDRLFVVGIKTTCKDRWRQVLREGPRVRHRHILTTQPGISAAQLREMTESWVSLVVPDSLHDRYPPGGIWKLSTVSGFLDTVRTALAP